MFSVPAAILRVLKTGFITCLPAPHMRLQVRNTLAETHGCMLRTMAMSYYVPTFSKNHVHENHKKALTGSCVLAEPASSVPRSRFLLRPALSTPLLPRGAALSSGSRALLQLQTESTQCENTSQRRLKHPSKVQTVARTARHGVSHWCCGVFRTINNLGPCHAAQCQDAEMLSSQAQAATPSS
jgi:hypothetical protein